MIERRGGSIINISSIAAAIAMPNMATYGAQKAAVEVFTRSWARSGAGTAYASTRSPRAT